MKRTKGMKGGRTIILPFILTVLLPVLFFSGSGSFAVTDQRTDAPEAYSATDTDIDIDATAAADTGFLWPSEVPTDLSVPTSFYGTGFWKKALDEIEYYREIALNSEFGVRDGKVHKWKDKVLLYIYPGSDAEKYGGFIKEHIDALNSIEGFPGIVLTEESDVAALTLEFVSRDKMKMVLSEAGKSNADANGYVTVTWYNANGCIFKGNIYIVCEADSGDEDVKHTILEEITQSTGLMNDSFKYEDSIFYQGYSTAGQLSETDWLILRIHYSGDIESGWDFNKVKDAVVRLANN